METAALRNYAEALYEEAAERQELPAALAGLEAAANLLSGEPELQRVAAHPGISDPRKLELFTSALGERGTPLVADFLRLVLERRRIADLPGIAAAFRRTVEERAGRQPVPTSTDRGAGR